MRTNCIHLVDAATLDEASDLVRDGEFADGDLHFDSSRQTVVLSIWKADEDLSSIERGRLLARWRVSPMRRLELTLRSVSGVQFVRQSSGTVNHPLGGIRWDKRQTVCIDTYDGVTVELTVDRLDGTLQVTDEVDRTRIQRGCLCSLWPFGGNG